MTSIAMKVYDLQWFTTYGMGMREAAQALVDDGIDTVLAQNRYDPLPSSGVDQSAYLAAYGDRLACYDDQAWMESLRDAGLRVIQTSAVFFDPPALNQFPDARPINALGESDQGYDWYVGVCPTAEHYLNWKIDRIRRVVDNLAPDGLFLQFTRFPGFWENWTWNPHYQFTASDQFCFCDRCLSHFQSATGIDLADGPTSSKVSMLLGQHREAWTAWRCEWLTTVIDRITSASGARVRGMEIVLNTLPFPSHDFEGADVRRTIAGQDLQLLGRVIDGFELMTYLQILNRPTSWLEDAVADARKLVPATARVLCSLQSGPLYTEGVHAGRNRNPAITASELEDASRAALRIGVDGLVFYHWTDFLDDEAAGGTKRQVLRSLRSIDEEYQ
ncbi:hypothetical protein BH23CHL5_BH23CHL5_13480 [soil metagenome]